MDEGEQVINSSLLYNVIENGVIEPKYCSSMRQVMSLADGEISKYSWKTERGQHEDIQRSITKYLAAEVSFMHVL